MSEPLTKVAIVIPVHNRRDTTLQALRSLARIDTSGLDLHLIVVDDGSTDGTSEAIRMSFPDVQIVRGDGTLHYAGGTNIGIEAALLSGPEFVVTANDDTIFHEKFLQSLILSARNNPDSVIGGLLLLWDKPDKIFQVGFEWRTMRGGWRQPHGRSVSDFPSELFEVEGLAGNCVLIPTRAIRECGLMDSKRFPHGWGDIQYFVRMRKRGWRLLVDPKALVWCEPNSYPPPLHMESMRRRIDVLFRDSRHPLNLHRQFIARWESAPTKVHALAGFAIYVIQLTSKATKQMLGRTG